MMEWHDEFRAYARAFGKDEVAAILMRRDGDEWIAWPNQTVEGLTFTLDGGAILDTVAPDDLQYVVGWVHSHPMGMAPTPSGTDHGQIRQYARDLAGGVGEMVIFGGHDYRQMSVTRGVLVGDDVFLSDTVTYTLALEATPWDEAAAAFRKSAEPIPVGPVAGYRTRGAFSAPWQPMSGGPDIPDGGYLCSWCSSHEAPSFGEICESCKSDELDAWSSNGAYM